MKKLALLVLAAFFLAALQTAHIAQAAPFPVYNMLEHIENPDCIVIEASRTPPEWGSKLDGYYVFQPEDLHIVAYQDHKIVQMTVYQLMGKKLKYFDDFRFSIDPMKGQWGTGDAVEWRKIEDLAPLYGPLDPETNSWQANFSTMAQTVMQYLQFERPDLYEEVTGHAAQTTPVPLLDHVNVTELVERINTGLGQEHAASHLSVPVQDTPSSQIVGHPVYIAHAGAVSAFFHVQDGHLLQVNLVTDQHDRSICETMLRLMSEIYFVAGMTVDEAVTLVQRGVQEEEKRTIMRSYCAAAQRMMVCTFTANGKNVAMILTATRD